MVFDLNPIVTIILYAVSVVHNWVVLCQVQ